CSKVTGRKSPVGELRSVTWQSEHFIGSLMPRIVLGAEGMWMAWLSLSGRVSVSFAVENSGCLPGRKAERRTGRPAWHAVQLASPTCASSALPRCSRWHWAQAGAARRVVSIDFAGCGAPSWQALQAWSGTPPNAFVWQLSQRSANSAWADDT